MLPSVIGARPAAGVSADDLAARINAASDEADALTRAEAAAETPGVADVQRSFDVIFLLFALVVPLVTGLFFLIITLQKARALTLLRAIGAPAGVLVRSLLVQVVIIIGGGVAARDAALRPPVAGHPRLADAELRPGRRAAVGRRCCWASAW